MTRRQISDVDLARLIVRAWVPAEPCELEAPCAIATWNGTDVSLQRTGRPMSPAAALIARDVAEHLAWLAGAQPAPAALAPTIDALEADYAAAVGVFGALAAPEAVFAARLSTCRACELWREGHLGGRGRCDSLRCACTARYPWMLEEACPEGRWSGALERLNVG